MVITGRTRNAVVRKGSWVRIPPPPPDTGMWLSLVEHYVLDVGAAGSNPVIPTKNRQGSQETCRFFVLFSFISSLLSIIQKKTDKRIYNKKAVRR